MLENSVSFRYHCILYVKGNFIGCFEYDKVTAFFKKTVKKIFKLFAWLWLIESSYNPSLKFQQCQQYCSNTRTKKFFF